MHLIDKCKNFISQHPKRPWLETLPWLQMQSFQSTRSTALSLNSAAQLSQSLPIQHRNRITLTACITRSNIGNYKIKRLNSSTSVTLLDFDYEISIQPEASFIISALLALPSVTDAWPTNFPSYPSLGIPAKAMLFQGFNVVSQEGKLVGTQMIKVIPCVDSSLV